MQDDVTDSNHAAFVQSLSIKHLLHTPSAPALDQETVYHGRNGQIYATPCEHIAWLANGLQRPGTRHGNTVAVMDWDSPRYLECYFAIAMMGTVLQTVKVRLSQDEVAHTIRRTMSR